MEENNNTAKLQLIAKMTSEMDDDARMGLIRALYDTLEDDNKVDMMDWFEKQMAAIVKRKLGRAAVKAGDKVGDLLDKGREGVEAARSGLARQFSEFFKKEANDDGSFGASNPYDETTDDDNQTSTQ